MTEIKTVVFDLGGVLIDWNPRYLYNKIFSTEEEVDFFLDNICTSEWNAEQDAGRRFADAVEILQKDFPDYSDAIAAYDVRWTETLGPADQETVTVLKQVKQTGLPVYALTNWSCEKFPIARQRFDFLAWFVDILVSGEVGLKKPDPGIFELFLERYQLDAPSTFFIDDNEENIRVAAGFGMHAVRFTDAAALKEDLTNLGVFNHK
jgi:2-haloacid dehalogenase